MELGPEGKIALITGGSRGIGRALARRLADEGCALMLVARTERDLVHAAADIGGATGRRVEIAVADLATREGTDAASAAAKATFGRLDILVNNAGAGRIGDFFSLTDEDWRYAFANKFFAMVRMSRALWPLLTDARGSVVNIAGTRGITPAPHIFISSAVNAAVINFSKALANQGLIDDVNVNVVLPGVVATELHDRYVAEQAALEGIAAEEVRAKKLAADGVRRFATVEDVADAVAFLVSPTARHVQGTMTVIDGGGTRTL